LGIGSDVVPPGGFRLRFGYEIAYPRWLIYSLALDTDYQRRLTIAPVVEVASAGLPVSAALGLGLPLRMFRHLAVDIRSQAGRQLPVLGLVPSVDVYPAECRRADPDRVDLLLLGRVSF
jgi:hypothetical protein